MRIFEFESSKRRMSVIVRKSGTKDLQVYVKGAPEIMSDICQHVTEVGQRAAGREHGKVQGRFVSRSYC